VDRAGLTGQRLAYCLMAKRPAVYPSSDLSMSYSRGRPPKSDSMKKQLLKAGDTAQNRLYYRTVVLDEKRPAE